MLVGYARVSTQDQNPDLQIDALKAAGCERIFVEHASGAQRDRPELKAAQAFLREGDTLVVWKLDRLARSLKQLIETVEVLGDQKIGFKSLTENVDTSSAGGLLLFHLFGSLAEFERSIIRERTKAGLISAKERGRTGGRPRALTETDMHAARALLGDPSITVAETAKRLKISISTLYKYFPAARAELRYLRPSTWLAASPS